MFSTETVNPDNSFINTMPHFYFNGDCEDTDTEAAIKSNSLNVLNGLAPPLFINKELFRSRRVLSTEAEGRGG